MSKEPITAKKENYTIELNYSKESEEKKLMRFSTNSGDQFEISCDELIEVIATQVNTKTLAPLFIESDKVNMVEVQRQIAVKVNRDIKEGEEIRIDYVHPLPVEFALLEEVYKIAKIKQDVPVFTLTKEYIDKVTEELKPEMEEFITRFYKNIKSLELKK